MIVGTRPDRARADGAPAARPAPAPATASEPGPPEPFDDFYAREYRGIVLLATFLTGDRAAAEDLAQDAFLAASGRWDVIGAYESPRGWVQRVVSNRSVSRHRRRLSEARALLRITGRRAVADDVELPETDDRLWSAVRRLPPRQAQAVALVYVADLTLAQAADTMGCGTETVKTHLSRGRAALAAQLGTEEP